MKNRTQQIPVALPVQNVPEIQNKSIEPFARIINLSATTTGLTDQSLKSRKQTSPVSSKRSTRMNRKLTLAMDNFIAITKALSDPHRVRALLALRRGELCVCQIIELLGLAPSTISKHMSILKQAGLVVSRKDSRWVYYRLTEDTNREQGVRKVVNLTVSLLERDERTLRDDVKMAEITSEGLDTLCKRQRCPTD
jgi:ArsR family transcriptional regulator